MKGLWILATAVAAVAALIVWSSLGTPKLQESTASQEPTVSQESTTAPQGTTVGSSATAPEDFVGDWEVTTRTIAGTTQVTLDEVSIEAGASKVFMGKTAIKFLSTENGISKVLVKGIGDDVTEGGGGPRKGICRINDEGFLEILEAGTGDDDFPVDFSQQQQTVRGATYSCLRRAQ